MTRVRATHGETRERGKGEEEEERRGRKEEKEEGKGGEAGSGAQPRENFKNAFLPCFQAPLGVLLSVFELYSQRSSCW